MATRPVTVRILHPDPGAAAGPLERWVSSTRAELAERHRVAFLAAGAADVAIHSGPPDDTPFGARLREIVRVDKPAGLVILGSGAIPLASEREYIELVRAAGVGRREALANNRFSADVVAIGCAEMLGDVPDLPGDNALPRWLAEVAGFAVKDLSRRWRLAFDLDGPLDLVLLGRLDAPAGVDLGVVRRQLAAVRAVAANRRAELIVSGRASVRTLAWLERGVPARVRAIVEERGMRAASRLAQQQQPAEDANSIAPAPSPAPRRTPLSRQPPASQRPASQRPPASLLGTLLERDGPGALGEALARLGEAAIVDTRVLLAHRLGANEAAWPGAEDRFASDLLLPARIRDTWLRALTEAAADATIPIVLGGHTLVGPGARLLLARHRVRGVPWT